MSDDTCSNESLEGAAVGGLGRVAQGTMRLSAPEPAGAPYGDNDILLPMAEEVATISGRPFPARPSTIKYVHVAKTHTNHTYRDFTNMPVESNYVFPDIEQMTFHERIYHLLTLNTTQRRLAIDWCCHGRAFHIINVEYLEHLGILRCYFGFNSLQRLRKQFNNYGYKLLLRASSKECYYSEYGPPAVNRRRLLPDPSNEPNFDRISVLFPLPGDRRALVTEARSRLESRGYYISDDVFELVATRQPTTTIQAQEAAAPDFSGS